MSELKKAYNAENYLLRIEYFLNNRSDIDSYKPVDLSVNEVNDLAHLISDASISGASNEQIISSLEIMKNRTGQPRVLLPTSLIERLKSSQQLTGIDEKLIKAVENSLQVYQRPPTQADHLKSRIKSYDAKLSESSRHPDMPLGISGKFKRGVYNTLIAPITSILGVKAGSNSSNSSLDREIP